MLKFMCGVEDKIINSFPSSLRKRHIQTIYCEINVKELNVAQETPTKIMTRNHGVELICALLGAL